MKNTNALLILLILGIGVLAFLNHQSNKTTRTFIEQQQAINNENDSLQRVTNRLLSIHMDGTLYLKTEDLGDSIRIHVVKPEEVCEEDDNFYVININDPCADEVIIPKNCLAEITPKNQLEKSKRTISKKIKEHQEKKKEEGNVEKKKEETVVRTVPKKENGQQTTPSTTTMNKKEAIMNVTTSTDENVRISFSDTSTIYYNEEGYHSDTSFWQSETYTDNEGRPMRFITYRYLANHRAHVGFDRYIDGNYDTTLLKRTKQTPLLAEEYELTSTSFNHEFLQKSIDEALLKKGNRQLYSGLGITGLSTISHFLLHRQQWPVRQTINGMDYYDLNNPYREANLQAKNERMWLYVWEGATYLATGTGIYLVVKGALNKNAAVIVTPTSIGLKVQF